MSLDIFVQSRGQLPKHDYTWVHLKKGKQAKVDNPVPHELRAFLDSEALSLLLAPLGNQQLLLVVANLETKRGTDSFGRPVRNSIACIGEAKDEANLRGIAACALRGEHAMPQRPVPLADVVNSEVQFDKKSDVGFRVGPSLQEQLSRLKAMRNDEPYPGKILDENSEAMRLALADDLDTRVLPRGHRGLLVVVTRYVDPRQLMQANVWRGFSALVDQQFLAELQQPKAPRLTLPRLPIPFPKRHSTAQGNQDEGANRGGVSPDRDDLE